MSDKDFEIIQMLKKLCALRVFWTNSNVLGFKDTRWTFSVIYMHIGNWSLISQLY